jgi:hypothetical protein
MKTIVSVIIICLTISIGYTQKSNAPKINWLISFINKDKKTIHNELIKLGFEFLNRGEVARNLKDDYDEKITYSLSITTKEGEKIEECVWPYTLYIFIKNNTCFRIDMNGFGCFLKKWEEELLLIDARLIHDWKEVKVEEDYNYEYWFNVKEFKFQNYNISFYSERRYHKNASKFYIPNGGPRIMIEKIN